MPADSPDAKVAVISLADCVERYGDPATVELLARLRQELGQAQLAWILAGRPASHWETRALRKRGYDAGALRADLVGPILAQIAAGTLLCRGFDAAEPANQNWISIPAARAGAFVFDFAASEAVCGGLRLTRVMVRPAKKQAGAKRAPREVLRSWYRIRVESFGAAGKRSNFVADMEAAVSEFGDLVTEVLIKEIRKDLAPESWKKPGPRAKQPDIDPAKKSSG